MMQCGKMIIYASRKLKNHEKNNPTHDLELAAVILTIKDLASLFVWGPGGHIHGPKDSSIYLQIEKIKSTVEKMA